MKIARWSLTLVLGLGVKSFRRFREDLAVELSGPVFLGLGVKPFRRFP